MKRDRENFGSIGSSQLQPRQGKAFECCHCLQQTVSSQQFGSIQDKSVSNQLSHLTTGNQSIGAIGFTVIVHGSQNGDRLAIDG